MKLSIEISDDAVEALNRAISFYPESEFTVESFISYQLEHGLCADWWEDARQAELEDVKKKLLGASDYELGEVKKLFKIS